MYGTQLSYAKGDHFSNYGIRAWALVNSQEFIFGFLRRILFAAEMLRYLEFPFFMAAILNGQNSGHIGICANVNIDFQVHDGTYKIYSFSYPTNFQQKYTISCSLKAVCPQSMLACTSSTCLLHSNPSEAS